METAVDKTDKFSDCKAGSLFFFLKEIKREGIP